HRDALVVCQLSSSFISHGRTLNRDLEPNGRYVLAPHLYHSVERQSPVIPVREIPVACSGVQTDLHLRNFSRIHQTCIRIEWQYVVCSIQVSKLETDRAVSGKHVAGDGLLCLDDCPSRLRVFVSRRARYRALAVAACYHTVSPSLNHIDDA